MDSFFFSVLATHNGVASKDPKFEEGIFNMLLVFYHIINIQWLNNQFSYLKMNYCNYFKLQVEVPNFVEGVITRSTPSEKCVPELNLNININTCYVFPFWTRLTSITFKHLMSKIKYNFVQS